MATMTFRQAAHYYIARRSGTWRSQRHRQQWVNTLETYVHPHLGNKPVDKITTHDVWNVLEPHWQTRLVTMMRVRSRIAMVLAYGLAQAGKPDAHVAEWHVMANLLPAPSQVYTVHHMVSAPASEVPAILAKAGDDVVAQALRWTVVTACRTGETLQAEHEQIDHTTATWCVRLTKEKRSEPRRIPLPEQVLPSPGKSGRMFPISHGTMRYRLQRICPELHVHGFRTSFAQWAMETLDVPGDVVELCLGHVLPRQTSRAYLRTDLLEKRRIIMQAWAVHCVSQVPVEPQLSSCVGDAGVPERGLSPA